jgi:hypothetical protein
MKIKPMLNYPFPLIKTFLKGHRYHSAEKGKVVIMAAFNEMA